MLLTVVGLEGSKKKLVTNERLLILNVNSAHGVISPSTSFALTCPKYVVRDKYGSVFTPTEILHDLRQKNRGAPKWSRYLATKYDFIYRETPVPHTGKRRHSFHTWCKTPRTAQELRWNEAYKGYTRGKRHKGYLPTAWDDYPRGDIDNRKNWKSCRKTQWK